MALTRLWRFSTPAFHFALTVSNIVGFKRIGVSSFPLSRTSDPAAGPDRLRFFIFEKFRQNFAPIDEGTKSRRFLGTEADLYANWQITSDLSFVVRFMVFSSPVKGDYNAKHSRAAEFCLYWVYLCVLSEPGLFVGSASWTVFRESPPVVRDADPQQSRMATLLIRRSGCSGLSFLYPLTLAGVGCQSAIGQMLPKSLAGDDPDSQLAFWHTLPTRKVVSNDEAFHAAAAVRR